MTARDDDTLAYEVAEALIHAALDTDRDQLDRIVSTLVPDPQMLAARRVVKVLARTLAAKARLDGDHGAD